MQTKPLDDVMDDLRDCIRREVATGFLRADEIAESALELLSDEHDPERLRPMAEALARMAVEQRLREEAAWPEHTDCDRLDLAFAELEEGGIVARQHFSCCQSCGSTEIWDEVDEAEDEGRTVRGYTFYHMQDTEAAVDGGGVFLAYGAAAEGDEAILEIAREVVETLRRHGFAPDWDGSARHRIHVPLEWKRRLPA